ncbi:MAG TPA: fibronectin type III domain-containing protein, partial [Cellulomonas sp.]|nr:fibronectin type III domain-containing protein [Cellulomonas sp.]
ILQVTWSEPKNNGDRVGTYEVTVDGPGGTTATVPAGTRSYTFSGATTGQPYKVSVRAKNKAGWGTPGTTTASTFGLPGVPGGVAATATAGDGSITVSWSPAGDNGSPITAYELRQGDGAAQSVGGSRTSFTFTGLDGGKTYQYQVRSVNAAGSSAWSSAVSDTATTPPGKPDSLALEVTDTATGGRPTRMKASWAPVATGGGENLTYTYTVRAGSDLATGTTSGTSVTFDVPRGSIAYSGTDVTLTVRATTTIGGTAFPGSAATATKTFRWGQAPGDVTNLVVAADASTNPTRFDVTWRAPASDGGVDISDYEIMWNNGSGWTAWKPLGSTATSTSLAAADVLGASPADGAYTVSVRVRAKNSIGTGGYDEDSTDVVLVTSPPPDPGGG